MLGKDQQYHTLPGNDDQGKSKTTSWKNVAGFLCLLAMILCWVFASEFSQDTEYIREHDFLVRCLLDCTCIFSGMFAFLYEYCSRQGRSKEERVTMLFWNTAPFSLAGLLLSIGSGYLWWLSLQHITTALGSSLFQTQCVFTYILCVIILGERITVVKSSAVILALSGVFLIYFDGDDHKDDTDEIKDDAGDGNIVKGLMLAVLGALFYAMFKVLLKFVELKYYDKDHLIRDSQYFIGFTGIWCIFASPLVIYVFHLAGWEHFELPSDLRSMHIIF